MSLSRLSMRCLGPALVALPWLAVAGENASAAPMDDPIGVGSILRMVVSLLIVGAGAVAVALMMRRYGVIRGLTANRRIRLIESARISRRTLLAVVHIDGREFVLVENGDQTRISPLGGPSTARGAMDTDEARQQSLQY
ncbi:MAG: hypothetical protein WED00_11200 [Aquisalimonadaceae bacterium]